MNFYLPDFYYFYNQNRFVIEELAAHPECFFDNLKIASLYGTFPECIWNGGRVQCGEAANFYNILKTIESINDFGVAIRFTYTNSLLTEDMYNDVYANLITEIGHNGKNEILVNDARFEKYLRNKYPNYKYVLSTTKCIRDARELNTLLDNYNMVVMDYRDNKNRKFIDLIKQKDKVELLINASCDPNCTRRLEHYLMLSLAQLNQSVEPFECEYLNRPFHETIKLPTVFTNDEVEDYCSMGFTNFKLEGRTMNVVDLIEHYIYYLIKPEFRDEYRNRLLKYTFG